MNDYKQWSAVHTKTGNEYTVIGEALNGSNKNPYSNNSLIIYERCGKIFVRDVEEFMEKFTRHGDVVNI